MARILRRTKSGEPAGRVPARPAGRERAVLTDKKQGIRTLIKVDESKGRTMPEFGRITDKKGVDTGNGFATRAVTILSGKRAPQPTGQNKRTVRKASLGPLKRRKSGT